VWGLLHSFDAGKAHVSMFAFPACMVVLIGTGCMAPGTQQLQQQYKGHSDK
jgi:hypothetical protein